MFFALALELIADAHASYSRTGGRQHGRSIDLSNGAAQARDLRIRTCTDARLSYDLCRLFLFGKVGLPVPWRPIDPGLGTRCGRDCSWTGRGEFGSIAISLGVRLY